MGNFFLLARVLILFMISFGFIQASFVLDDELLLSKTTQKLEQIGEELYAKSGISLLLNTKLIIDTNITSYEKSVANDLNISKYILITLVQNIHKVDITGDPKSLKLINKNKILDDYIIPIIITKSKNSQQSSYSAAMLNGYSQVAEEISSKLGIEMNTTIGNQSRNTFKMVKIFVYAFFFITVFLIFFRRSMKK